MLPRWYPNKVDKADGNFIQKHIQCISEYLNVCVVFVKGINETGTQSEIIELKKGHFEIVYYYKLNNGPLSFIINPLAYILTLFSAYNKIYKEFGKPVLSHVHVMARSSLLANYLSFFGIPFVISEHWSGYYADSNKLTTLKKIIYKLLYYRAKAVTSVSKNLADAISKLTGNGDIRIIPNVVDGVFTETNTQNQKLELKRLVHISNFRMEIKQCDKMLIYLNEAIENRNDVELYMIGEGPDKEDLISLCKTLPQLQNRVTFTGDISQQEIAEILQSATATISFSKFETQSIVLLESIAMNVPIVAPNIGGISEYGEERGLLFPPGSKDRFQSAILKILEDEIQFDTKDMRSYIVDNYSCKVIGNKFITLYKEIIPSLNV